MTPSWLKQQYEPMIRRKQTDRICGNLHLPGGSWNTLRLSTESDAVYVGACERDGDDIAHMLLPKLIKFFPCNDQVGSVLSSVFVRGKLHSQSIVASSADAQAIVDATHTLTMCSGCGMKPANISRYVAFAGLPFSTKCTLVC